MIMKLIYSISRSILCLSCIAVAAASCAKDFTYGKYYSTDKVLDAWVETHYGPVAKDTSGIYILEEIPGSGKKVNDSSFVFVNYTCKSLYMEVSSTNDSALLEMDGSLDGSAAYTTYLGPRIWRMGQGALPYGVESALRRMKEGGKIKIALPVERTKVDYTIYQQFSSTQVDNVIYDLHLVRVHDDIGAYQDSLLREHSRKYFGGIDTVFDGFYIAKTGCAAEADSLEDDEVVDIRYIGRRLDGTVFDTNIIDSAYVYNLSSVSTDSLVFTYYKDGVKMYNNNLSYISGFSAAINRMRHRDTIEAFFRSDYGYGVAGNGASIPEFSPLSFKIFIQESKSSDDSGDEED